MGVGGGRGHGGLGWLKGIKDFKDCFLWIQTSLVSLAAVSSRRSAPTWALHDETKTAAKETKTSLDIIVYIAPEHLSVQMGDTHCQGEGGGGGGGLMGNVYLLKYEFYHHSKSAFRVD